jgi:sugar phosphate isomerase/epimerase
VRHLITKPIEPEALAAALTDCLDRAARARRQLDGPGRRGYRPRVPRVSVSQITTPGWPFDRDVEAFAAAGASGIGVAIRKLEAYGVAPAARRLRGAGLPVSCLTSSGRFPLGDAAGERAALARTRRHLEAAAELGAAVLFVLPGPAGAASWEEAAARCRPLVEALLPDAERLGVRLALEPTSQLRMDLSFLHTFDEALDFVDAIASPWLGVVLELNNAWIERRLYHNIADRTDRIAIVQVNDFKVGTLRASERVVMGDGDIPLRRILGALEAAGYAGWYDVELLGPAIDAEGYASVVPRALARLGELWP